MTFKDFLIWMNRYPEDLNCPACGKKIQIRLSRLFIMFLLVPVFYIALYFQEFVVANIISLGMVGNVLIFLLFSVTGILLVLYVIYWLALVFLSRQ